MRIVLLLVMLTLAGCGTRTVTETITVQVPVPVPCIDKPLVEPDYQTGRGEYPGDREAARILADDFEKAEQHGRDWAAAATGCYR